MRTSNLEPRTSASIDWTAKQRAFGSAIKHIRKCSEVCICLILLITLTTGCCNPKPPSQANYIGPTESMDAVIAQINHNSAHSDALDAAELHGDVGGSADALVRHGRRRR